METAAIGTWDTTLRGNKWIASALSIIPGLGHLYLAEYHDAKRNYSIGTSLITVFIQGTIAVTLLGWVSTSLYMIYVVGVICSALDAYHNGRNRRRWSGVVM